MTPFQSVSQPVFDVAQREFQDISIKVIVDAYKEILPTFYELSKTRRQSYPVYNNAFITMITKVNEVFAIKQEFAVIVNVRRFAEHNAWQHIYWSFVHYLSILIADAYSRGLIDNFLDFALFLYNIDNIILCTECQGHYRDHKNDQNMFDVVNLLTSGLIVRGTIVFHNEISESINDRIKRDKTARKHLMLFKESDFALKYNCLEIYNELELMSQSYAKARIVMQPETHTLLSVILSAYLGIEYQPASLLLKKGIYPFNCNDGDNDSWMAEKPVEYTKPELEEFLMQALSLNFKKDNALTANVALQYALFKFHSLFLKDVKVFTECNPLFIKRLKELQKAVAANFHHHQPYVKASSKK